MTCNRNNTTNHSSSNKTKEETARKFTSLDDTQMRVFVREFDRRVTASTSIGVKNESGEYDNLYIPVNFVNGEPAVDGMCEVLVKRGFWSAYYSKKLNTMLPKIVIMEYEEV